MHEHPLPASLWELACVRKLAHNTEAFVVRTYMCQYGLKSRDQWGEGLVEKGTYLMTNSATIARRMAKRCQGGHRHVHLIEGRAAAAAKYTE